MKKTEGQKSRDSVPLNLKEIDFCRWRAIPNLFRPFFGQNKGL
jgi:hypothetical protein